MKERNLKKGERKSDIKKRTKSKEKKNKQTM